MKFMLKIVKKRESCGCGKRTEVIREDLLLRMES